MKFGVDYLVKCRTENDIEAEALELRKHDPMNNLPVFREALQRIDKMKIAGDYVVPDVPPHSYPNPMTLEEEGLQRYLELRKSADADQRRRLEQLRDHVDLATKTVGEVLPVLAMLEPAQKPPGTHKLPTPWTNELEAMDTIHLLVERDGMSIPDAARQCATSNRAPNRWKKIAELYRAKMRLRNLN